MDASLQTALSVLHDDGVIACPTDTIPGLSCFADSEPAIRRILDIKQRPPDKGLILLADTVLDLGGYIVVPDDQEQATITSTHEPTTWLVPAADGVSPLIRGRFDTVAVRLCRHPLIRQLVRHSGKPLVSTSANLGGQSAPEKMQLLDEKIISAVDYVLNGPNGTGRASTIRALVDNRRIR